jgi:cupin fold WbuC family metalloprotein
MFIAIQRSSYIHPHRHLNKTESFHIIDGAADLIIFTDNGDISKVISLRSFSNNDNFFCRLNNKCFHTLNITSNVLIIHEITNGPFQQGEAEFADWAPNKQNRIAVSEYTKKISDFAANNRTSKHSAAK